jgi:peptidoglycan hydrolase CwlO-like protein
MMHDLLIDLEKVTSLGKQADSLDHQLDPTRFLDILDSYLQELESWQKKYQDTLGSISNDVLQIPDDQRLQLREKLDQIKSFHEGLTMKAEGLMSEVHSELGTINKRARGIRKYVDTLPQRVSVTPRKKG